MFAGPVHLRASTDFQEQIEFFCKERVIVFQTQAEEGAGFNEGAPAGDNFGASPGDEVESRELLENANRVGGAQNRDCAGETDIFRARGGSGEDHNGSRVQELRAVMFANAEDLQTDPICELNLLE